MALLREPSDRRTLVFVASTYLLSWGGYFLFPQLSWWAVVPWVLFTSWMSWLCAVITHNTVHVPIFHSRALNRWFQVVLTLAYGHPVSSFVPGHNLSHHLHTQTRRDVMRSTKMRFRWNLLNVLLAPTMFARDILASDWNYAVAMRTQRPRWFRQWVFEWVVFGIVQVTFLVLNPLAYLLFMFIPHNAAAGGIVGINFLQHDGADHTSEWNHSRNFVGPWINWWAFNNGYHTVHHKYPNLHWSKCREVHETEVGAKVHPNLNVPNMLSYLFHVTVWPGKRIDYMGRPLVLPDEGPDESWIPAVHEHPAAASTGAEA